MALLNGSCLPKEKNNHGPIPIAKGGFQNVVAHADMGFYAFSFGAPKTYAYQSFQVKLKEAAWLSITDGFCPGDTFQVFDNGVPLAVTILPTDADLDCATAYDDNAWNCFVGPNHAKRTVFLNPGHHNLTITSITGPYGGGTGFIRLDTSCTPVGQQPVPCCWIVDAENPNEDYQWSAGRFCNQMVTYP